MWLHVKSSSQLRVNRPLLATQGGYLHVLIGGMPGTAVSGGREMGGMPGIEMLEMGGKLAIAGKGAIPGMPIMERKCSCL